MPIGLNEDMTPIDFGFTRLEVKVTMVTIVNNVNMISAPYLENCLTQSFHILHGLCMTRYLNSSNGNAR